MLSLLIILPLIGVFCLLSVPEKKDIIIKQIALLFSSLTFLLSLFLWVFFDCSTSKFQFIEHFNWVSLFNIHFFISTLKYMYAYYLLLWTYLTISFDGVLNSPPITGHRRARRHWFSRLPHLGVPPLRCYFLIPNILSPFSLGA